MNEEIKEDNNCIVKAFENNPISIISENIDNKKIYYFKASDIGKALELSNIAVSIQHYDEDERVIRKAYDTEKRMQNTTFLTSQGVYRLLYNSKKDVAKKFRKWAGNILDDIIFNESKELKIQLEKNAQQVKDLTNTIEKKDKLLEMSDEQIEKTREKAIIEQFPVNTQCIYYGKIDNKSDHNEFLIKGGNSNDLENRVKRHKQTYTNFVLLAAFKVNNKVEFENDIKSHPILKYRTRKIVINDKNYTELFAYDENFTINDIHQIFKDTIKEKELEMRFGIIQLQIELQLKQEETKQMQLQLEILREQRTQKEIAQKTTKIEQNEIIESLVYGPFDEKTDFINWLDINLTIKNGDMVIWKQLISNYLHKNIASGLSSKYKGYFESYVKNRFDLSVVFKRIRFNGQYVRGYENLKLM